MTFQSFPKPVKKIKDFMAESKRRNDKLREKYLQSIKNGILRPKKKVVKKKRVKLPTIRKLILHADKNFSVFIRQRDLRCVLCGSTTQLTNGHLIKRGKKSVRWDDKNCNCLCMGCNYKDNFEHDHYVVWWINKYSPLKYEQLVERSKGIFKPSREYLNAIIKQYEDKS